MFDASAVEEAFDQSGHLAQRDSRDASECNLVLGRHDTAGTARESTAVIAVARGERRSWLTAAINVDRMSWSFDAATAAREWIGRWSLSVAYWDVMVTLSVCGRGAMPLSVCLEALRFSLMRFSAVHCELLSGLAVVRSRRRTVLNLP
jgi:hypothetical protein